MPPQIICKFVRACGIFRVQKGLENPEASTAKFILFSASNREGYVSALREHISVHVYGDCGAPCPPGGGGGDCLSHIDRHYPFILVFEPFLCQHYQGFILRLMTD